MNDHTRSELNLHISDDDQSSLQEAASQRMLVVRSSLRESSMPYKRKIVLHCPRGYRKELDRMVEKFIADGVTFVGVVGDNCSRVEDIIDELVVGDGTDERRYILTSSHAGESIEDALEFARSLSNEYAGEVQLVEL